MTRGTIAWIDLSDAHPPELGKKRPAIVVSHSEHNQLLSTVIVVPLSSRAPEIWPLRVKLSGVTSKESFAIVPGLRQISKARVGAVIGRAPDAFMARLAEAVAMHLGDEFTRRPGRM